MLRPKNLTIRDVPQTAGPLAPILQDIKRALAFISKEAALNSDLVAAGILRIGNDGSPVAPATPEEERIVPPQPENVSWDAALTNVLVSFDGIGYVGHSHAEMLRAPTNDYSSAIVVQRSFGAVAADPLGPDRQAYYWLRFVSRSGIAGPPDTQAGTLLRTGANIEALLTVLEGSITESQLYAALGARIDLIDGPSSLEGSVAARILAEANARGTAITNEATLRQEGDDSLAQQMSLITAGVAGGFDYGKVWYFDASVEGWTSQNATQAHNTGWVDVTATSSSPAFTSPGSLAVSGSSYPVVKARIKRLAGTGWMGLCRYATSGHGYSSSYSKTIPEPSPFAVGDSAVVEFAMDDLTAGGNDWVNSVIDSIRFYFGAGSGDVISVDWVAIGRNAPGASVAGLLAEQTARINGDNAEAAARLALAATVNSNTAAITAEQTARADGDSANASSITTLAARVVGRRGIFNEDWRDANTLANWQNYSGDGEISIINTSSSAPKTSRLLNVGNYTDNDQVWYVHKDLIPFDHEKLYRMEVIVYRYAGTDGTIYAGFVGVAADGVTLVNAVGADSVGGQHYHVAQGASPAQGSYATYVGYTKGRASSGTGTVSPDPNNPGKMHSDVRYLRPMVLVNYPGQPGRTLVGAISISEGQGDELSVAIQEESTVRASETGHLSALHTLRLTAGNLIGGFGVSGTSGGTAGPTIDFGVRANKFYVAPPEGTSNTKYASFVYQSTATTLNGVSVPAGMYLSDAFIKNGSITNLKVGNAAIDTAKIANLAVSMAKIADLAVGSAKIADLAVTNGKIANLAVTVGKIANLAVETAKIDDLAVTNAKIANLAVDNAKIANLAVTTGKIANLAVDSAKIADLAVSTLKIDDNAVTVPLSARATGVSITAHAAIGNFDTLVSTGNGNFPAGAKVDVSCIARFGNVVGGTMNFRVAAIRSDLAVTVYSSTEQYNMSPGTPVPLIALIDIPSAGDWKFSLLGQKLNAVDTASSGTCAVKALGTKK